MELPQFQVQLQAGAMKIEEARDRFLLQLRADGRSAHTLSQFERFVRLLERWATGEPRLATVEGFGPQDLARFLASPEALERRDGQPKKATSVNAVRSAMRCFFGYLHRAGELPQDPSRLIRDARTGTPPPRCLSEEEQRRLTASLEAAEGEAARRDHALFALMLGTGIRVGSALGLEVEDVDLGRGVLQLRHTKGDQAAEAFLRPDLVEHLAGYIGGRKAGPLFPGKGGGPLSARQVHKRFEAWLGKAGIRGRYSPHSLRHSFAMALYRKTGDVLLVREALGHASLESTLVYARADRDRLREAMGAA